MAYSTPINFIAIETALVDWLYTTTGVRTMWSNQNRPQVSKPFLVLKLIAGPTILGRDEQRRRMVDDELFTDIVGFRSLTFNIQAFGLSDSPAQHAQSLLAIAQASLSTAYVREKFEIAKIGVVSIGPITDLDSIAGEGFESRASFDLVVSTVSALIPSEDEPTNWIETVELIDSSEG